MKKQLPLMHRIFELRIKGTPADGQPNQDPLAMIGKGALYDVAISSEEPANQWYWELGMVKETLSHSKGAVQLDRLKKTGAVLWNHDRYDQVGKLRSPGVNTQTKRLEGKISYSRTQRGQDFELDALDGIKVNVSVGYRVLEMKLTRRGDIQAGEIDEYLITKWEPYEVSIVSIPADVSVGIGRSQAEELARREGGEMFAAEIEDGVAVREDPQMKTKEELAAEAAKAAAEAEAAATRTAVAAPPPPAATPPQIEVSNTKRDKEVVEIIAMAKQNRLESKVPEWIARGLTADQVAREVLIQISNPALAQPPSERTELIATRDLKNYSLRRAILMTLPKNEGGIDFNGLEADVHRELEKNLPAGIKYRGGALIPTNMPAPDPAAAARGAKLLGRAYPLDSVTATEGQELKFTTFQSFIDMLRAKLICVRLGAKFLSGLTGPVGFPRKTGPSTANWRAEAAASADSMPAFELMTLSPKSLIDTTGTTRELLRMASEDLEALLRDDILKTHRVAIDTAAFVGTGASGQPSGIYVLANVTSYDVGPGANANAVPDYIDITTMIGLLGDANADDGAVAFAATPLLAATLMRTLTFPAANTGTAIWQGTTSEGTLGGYRALASNVLSKTLLDGVPTGGVEHGLVFGNFNELLIGEWGAFEIIADPYSSKKSGIVELTSFQMIDVNLRHPKSFVKGINAIP